jgi:hypothetical protein
MSGSRGLRFSIVSTSMGSRQAAAKSRKIAFSSSFFIRIRRPLDSGTQSLVAVQAPSDTPSQQRPHAADQPFTA